MEDIILKHALKNAFEHEGKAIAKAVISRVVGEKPEATKNMRKLSKEVEEVIEEVNKMGLDKQKKKLLEIWPDALEKKPEKPKELPKLPNAVKGKVVLRFAPNPNGPLHIGHTRQALLNWFYRNEYDGVYILRFDDTDPKTKPPLKEAYEWIIEDLEWLGVKPDKISYASDRLDIYKEHGENLLRRKGAYICTCDPEQWRELKNKKKACPCRELPIREQLKRWEKMFSDYKEGEAAYRVKTDIKHPNPAIRDWVAFKIVDKPNHPRATAKVWPLLNFASAIDDHLFGITHIIRGRDLDFTEIQQKYVYKYFKWDYPTTIVTGKIYLEGTALSTSKVLKGIKEKSYKGWDDPALGTLRALKKRGIYPETIQQIIFDLGVRKNNVNLVWENIKAMNNKIKAEKKLKETK